MFANAFERLLTRRPALSVTILIENWDYQRPHELAELSEKFKGRFSVSDDVRVWKNDVQVDEMW
ncbi:hypothetical protein DL93DRAFT_2075416 [Clavulina sp. PMI_390]|nr:hypothetical protein DL93DRAFT_2075416 [Clavulina sp. PMI_390]